ncbi:MAG: hypothetical protein M3552_14580, partial [Planctomycetota bacterium]|nr:hypothetical protein [Planctomycetota bacterium]
FEAVDLAERLFEAVGGFTDYIDLGSGGQQADQPGTHNSVVVDDQDSNRRSEAASRHRSRGS